MARANTIKRRKYKKKLVDKMKSSLLAKFNFANQRSSSDRRKSADRLREITDKQGGDGSKFVESVAIP